MAYNPSVLEAIFNSIIFLLALATMSYIAKFNQITPDQIEPALDYGEFACVSRVTGTKLAIKIPFPDVSHHLPNERRIYDRIGKHAFILRFYKQTSYISGGEPIPALLFQFLGAGTLKKNLNTLLWSENKLKWLLQITKAIVHIHSKGIIHGDLGSHNILVQDNNNLALCDFGGSSIDGSKILEHPKPRYARPRSAQSNAPTVQDDFFALGTVMLEIITGQKLYPDKSDDEIALLFCSQIFPDLEELVPPNLGEIIRKCWTGYYSVGKQINHDLRFALHRDLRHCWLRLIWPWCLAFLILAFHLLLISYHKQTFQYV